MGEPGGGTAIMARPSTTWLQPTTSSTTEAAARVPFTRFIPRLPLAPVLAGSSLRSALAIVLGSFITAHAAMESHRRWQTATSAGLAGAGDQFVEGDAEVIGEV